MELVTINNHEPPTHLVFHLLRCSTTKATSSRSSMCIHNQESRSSESSFSAILHRERVNKFLENDLCDCSLASSSSSSRLTYLFVGRAPRVITFNANSVRPIVISIRSSSSRTASHVRFLLSNHISHIEYFDLSRHNFAR
jgi:hypothetical protein